MKEQAQPDSSYTLLFVSLAYLRHITLRSGFGADPLSVGRLLGPARRPESQAGANISLTFESDGLLIPFLGSPRFLKSVRSGKNGLLLIISKNNTSFS